jgi:four helix bundle protein
MAIVKSYRDLEVWQISMEFVEAVYATIQKLPKDERFALSDQLRRSAISVPSNIAEGWGRASTKEYLHYLSIAYGSLMEAETQLILAVRLGYSPKQEAAKVWELASRSGMMINKLRASLKRRSSQS